MKQDIKSKQKASQQLAMELPVEEALSRDDLIASSSNNLAIELIDNWANWPAPVAILAGPTGSGKSHIANVWALSADAKIIDCNQLTELALHLQPATNVLLENAANEELDETALFHLINHVRAHSKSLLITTRQWPASWNLTLPDLKSRLRAAQLVELNEPDDQLLRHVLVKLFADRQLSVEPNVVEYCLVRMERSLASAQALVAKLDAEALAQRSKITRNLARKFLESETG